MNEMEIVSKVTDRLTLLGQKVNELFKKIEDNDLMKGLTTVKYGGDRSQITIEHLGHFVLTVSYSEDHSNVFKEYSATMVTNPENWWIEHNRNVDADTLEELADRIEHEERKIEDADRELDFVVDNVNRSKKQCSERVRKMFGI